MNCSNCNTNIKQGENFCKVCGKQVQENEYLQNNYEQIKCDNNVLIDAYIGKNVDKLKDEKFSLNVFFLGILYVLYRKMWLLGLVWFVGSLIVTFFLPSFSILISIIANVVIAVNFKNWYLKNVEEKVGKIKLENPEKIEEELIIICTKKGGTTIWPIIIFVLFYIVLFIFLISILMGPTEEKNNNIQTKEKNNNQEIITTEEFNDLTLKIPPNLKKFDYETDYYKSYKLLTETDYCRISILTPYFSKYKTSKEYLEKNIISNGIEEKQINGNAWDTLTVQNSSNITYHYAIKNNDKIYLVEFVIYNDGTKACSNAHSKIINSLSFK